MGGETVEKARGAEVARFVIGLGVIGYSLVTYVRVLSSKKAMGMFLYALIGTPYGLVLLFSLIPGLYFALTSRHNWRLDVIMGILAVLSIVLSTSAANS